MKSYFYRVKSEGITYGTYAKPEWAEAIAYLLKQMDWEDVEIEAEVCCVTTKREFEKDMRKWMKICKKYGEKKGGEK